MFPASLITSYTIRYEDLATHEVEYVTVDETNREFMEAYVLFLLYFYYVREQQNGNVSLCDTLVVTLFIEV